jgi:hypothetical protein
MSTRTSEEEVKGIMKSALDESELTPFVRSANTIINNNLVDKGLDDDTLATIEMWLAAHLATAIDPRNVETRVMDNQYKKEKPSTGLGLDGSFYGQQVKIFDTTGTLASLGQSIKEGMFTAL